MIIAGMKIKNAGWNDEKCCWYKWMYYDAGKKV